MADEMTWTLHGLTIRPGTPLSPAYAAELAGISASRLSDLARGGEIPSGREPSGRVYLAGDVMAWRARRDARRPVQAAAQSARMTARRAAQ